MLGWSFTALSVLPHISVYLIPSDTVFQRLYVKRRTWNGMEHGMEWNVEWNMEWNEIMRSS